MGAPDLGAADRLMAVVKRRPAKEAGPDAIREPLISSFAPPAGLVTLCQTFVVAGNPPP
jgi:hypothetical protein